VADLPSQGSVDIGSDDFAYFSYSGEHCEGGVFADYEEDDTCEGLDRAAALLRTQIDALAPSRVTVLSYSMGGLLTAYLAASDPAWAAERIASIVTFDAPLEGLDGFRGAVFASYNLFSDGCGARSDASGDLDDDSNVVEVARGAAAVVPLYTLDGTKDESRALGFAEAVPSGRTTLEGAVVHVEVPEAHSDTWNDAPSGKTAVKGMLVGCALERAGPECLEAP
jgi:pimeloyl-ACP methyl ester carboxylesterase